jgi:homoserine kinase
VSLARRRLVRVPASSANLGPGVDVLAAALALHLELVRAFERLHPADDFEFRITSQIPLSGGLGSSAAATLAGLMAADHLFELDADIRSLATAMEGHPDNVAAALSGGFVVCTQEQVHRFDGPMGLEAVLVVPDEPVSTTKARGALPENVPLADAAFNAGAAALLALGLATGGWELIAAGLHDRLHQPYRASLYPRSAALLERAASLGALGATISGAGPTVLCWCHYEHTGAVFQALGREVEGWAQVLRVPFESQGADVREL